MGTVTLKGSEYTYYVTTPASYTATPENLGYCLDAAFTPKITRNKTGDAFTRYFSFKNQLIPFAVYSAKFTKSSKTAVVRMLNADYYHDQGYSIYRKEFGDIGPLQINSITVTAGTTVASTFDDPFASQSIGCLFNASGLIPNDMEITKTLNSLLPDEFGNVSGYISAVVNARALTRWHYTDHQGYEAFKIVGATSKLTVNNRTETGQSGRQGLTRLSMETDNITEELMRISFVLTTDFNETASIADEVKLQPYSPPTLSSLKMTRIPLRGSTGVRIGASYALSSLNKESTETDEITTGYIRLKWYTTDENGDPVEGSSLNPNTYLICDDGDPLDSITGTCSIPSSTPYDNESSYTVHAWVEDRLGGKSDILRYTMPTEFRTIDIYPGGRGIAFGAAADNEGFYCAMPAVFDDLEVRGPLSGVNATFDDLTVNSDISALVNSSSDADLIVDLSTLGWSGLIDNDLFDIRQWIKEVTNKLTRGKTLLWTNPNPTSAFVGQTIKDVLTTYDEYEVVFTGYTGQPTLRKATRFPNGDSILTYITGSSGQVSGGFYVFKRQVFVEAGGIRFGEVYRISGSSDWGRYTANTGIVPYKIYGITNK